MFSRSTLLLSVLSNANINYTTIFNDNHFRLSSDVNTTVLIAFHILLLQLQKSFLSSK